MEGKGDGAAAADPDSGRGADAVGEASRDGGRWGVPALRGERVGEPECGGEAHRGGAPAARHTRAPAQDALPPGPPSSPLPNHPAPTSPLQAPSFHAAPTDVKLGLGEEVALKCSFRGVPIPSVTWYHGGKPVNVAPGIAITTQVTPIRSSSHGRRLAGKGAVLCQGNKSELVIKKVKASQAGEYLVAIRNPHGEDISSATVTLTGFSYSKMQSVVHLLMSDRPNIPTSDPRKTPSNPFCSAQYVVLINVLRLSPCTVLVQSVLVAVPRVLCADAVGLTAVAEWGGWASLAWTLPGAAFLFAPPPRLRSGAFPVPVLFVLSPGPLTVELPWGIGFLLVTAGWRIGSDIGCRWGRVREIGQASPRRHCTFPTFRSHVSPPGLCNNSRTAPPSRVQDLSSCV